MNNTPHIISLTIPHELSGLVVQGYNECGDYIQAKTILQRKQGVAKRITRLNLLKEVCTTIKERNRIEGEINALQKSETFKGNRTNRDRKIVGMFITLKAITKSGIIHCYRNRDQAKEIEQYTKKNLKTVEHYLVEMQALGLATITGKKGQRNRHIKLASWKTLCELFDLEFTNQFTIYNYDLNNFKQTPDYVLDGAEEAEKQENLYSRLIRKIRTNHTVMEFLFKHHGIKVINQKAIEKINQLRHDWFVNGFPSRSCDNADFDYCVKILYNLNTCVSRTRKKIQNVRNFLQARRVTYLKQALSERGIANVSNTTLKSNQNRVPDRNIHGNGFDRIQKLATWYLPTDVHPTEFTIKPTP
jgi:hypothetical protein